MTKLATKLNSTEQKLKNVQSICADCSSVPLAEPISCESLDCPWLYERKKIQHRIDSLQLVTDIIDDLQVDIYEAQMEVSSLNVCLSLFLI